MSRSGFAGGLFAMVLIAFVTVYSVVMLLRAVDLAGPSTTEPLDGFEVLGMRAGGAALRGLAEFTLVSCDIPVLEDGERRGSGTDARVA